MNKSRSYVYGWVCGLSSNPILSLSGFSFTYPCWLVPKSKTIVSDPDVFPLLRCTSLEWGDFGLETKAVVNQQVNNCSCPLRVLMQWKGMLKYLTDAVSEHLTFIPYFDQLLLKEMCFAICLKISHLMMYLTGKSLCQNGSKGWSPINARWICCDRAPKEWCAIVWYDSVTRL